MAADAARYLLPLREELTKAWPDNRAIHIVCHGHSVPAGYFATPTVDTLHAYPHLLLEGIKARYPHAVVNVIVTAIGGENSAQGAARFGEEVLCHRPDLITLDYGLNDRRIGTEAAEAAWRSMIEQAQSRGIPMILLTPSWDETVGTPAGETLAAHAAQIRRLADAYGLGLADSYAAWAASGCTENAALALRSQSNHPNARGHALIAQELLRYF